MRSQPSTRLRSFIAGIGYLGLVNMACTQSAVDGPVLGVEKALELPISDAHFHVMKFMQPDMLLTMMDKYKFKWAGGAGNTRENASMAEFQAAIGQRLRFYGGQRESVKEDPV